MKRRWYVLIALGLFAVVGWVSLSTLTSLTGGEKEQMTIWNLMMLSLGGPIAQDGAPLFEWSKWLMPHFLLLVMLGNSAGREWVERATFVLPRYLDRGRWWRKKVISLGGFSFLYFLLGIAMMIAVGSAECSWALRLGEWQGEGELLRFTGVDPLAMLDDAGVANHFGCQMEKHL